MLAAEISVLLMLLVLPMMLAQAQAPASSSEEVAPRPTPRLPDGRTSLSGPPGEIGNWNGSAVSVLANSAEQVASGNIGLNLPTNLLRENVPFLPWAREVYESRRAKFSADDPHTRCKPSGGARLFHTPYGFEILDLGAEIIFLSVGAPHSWRVVYMDGRDHPESPEPSWFGHSIGQWNGDTLVIDTVGFNDKFWFSRGGFPHTTQLHTIETITRPDFNTLRYEITIDDSGAYSDTWSGGFYIKWWPGNEPFDYLCQENNLDAERMIGPQE
jgi:hypothetical protein